LRKQSHGVAHNIRHNIHNT